MFFDILSIFMGILFFIYHIISSNEQIKLQRKIDDLLIENHLLNTTIDNCYRYIEKLENNKD